MNKSYIVPEKELRDILLSVQLPGRYVGGEFGTINKIDADFRLALCFPDLYEIGMSNLALRLLYREINALDDIACERVFTPAPDFEELIKQREVPLYTLESGTPVSDCDLVGFSVGYELSATNMLTVLETGRIPLKRSDRCKDDPVVIAGGPAVTNPLPFSDFLDGVWIGEAEESFILFIREMAKIKKSGGKRDAILSILSDHPNVWVPGEDKIASRSIWNGFSSIDTLKNGFIVPNISTVQDHGIVEIMRGCPSGCRFCHAGYFYRPFRQKSIEHIEAEVEFLIKEFGYREITLASLSSGDYNGIENLIRRLNNKWSSKHISFAFPSMRVSSVSLPLLDELSRVRKSGLTFAVETPDSGRQIGLNKDVPIGKVIEILEEAKAMGWQLAKFYFMLGLPFSSENEGREIADFLNEIQRRVKFRINANIGTFIPKPHTPFQWAGQLDEEESFKRIQEIRHNVSRGIKVGFHSPFISMLEGVLSRGDQKVGKLIHTAYKNGARLDAWDEYIKKDIWRNELESSGLVEEIFSEKTIDAELPWDSIDLGYTKKFLIRELEKTRNQESTAHCDTACDHNCGVCISGLKPSIAEKSAIITDPIIPNKQNNSKELQKNIQNWSMENKYRILFEFTKEDKAEYYSHINIMQIFERTFLRGDIPVRFTEGFNPKPRLEFAHPLALGYGSGCEIGAVDIFDSFPVKIFMEKMNAKLPAGLKIERCEVVKDPAGIKKRSLMSIFGGSSYLISFNNIKHMNLLSDISDEWIMKGVTIKKTDMHDCRVTIIQKGKESAPGLKKVLQSTLVGVSPGEYTVLRTGLYARYNGKSLGYFDYFKSQIS